MLERFTSLLSPTAWPAAAVSTFAGSRTVAVVLVSHGERSPSSVAGGSWPEAVFTCCLKVHRSLAHAFKNALLSLGYVAIIHIRPE